MDNVASFGSLDFMPHIRDEDVGLFQRAEVESLESIMAESFPEQQKMQNERHQFRNLLLLKPKDTSRKYYAWYCDDMVVSPIAENARYVLHVAGASIAKRMSQHNVGYKCWKDRAEAYQGCLGVT